MVSPDKNDHKQTHQATYFTTYMSAIATACAVCASATANRPMHLQCCMLQLEHLAPVDDGGGAYKCRTEQAFCFCGFLDDDGRYFACRS